MIKKKTKKAVKTGFFDVKITQIKITKKNEFYSTKNC